MLFRRLLNYLTDPITSDPNVGDVPIFDGSRFVAGPGGAPSWLLHTAGIPDNSVGSNGDYALGQDGTIYKKQAGTWGAYGGGGLPAWFQSGAGSPVAAVTPSQVGALYQDTTNGALYEAIGATDADWVVVGGKAGSKVGVQLSGTRMEIFAPGTGTVRQTSIDGNGQSDLHEEDLTLQFGGGISYVFAGAVGDASQGGFQLGNGLVWLFDSFNAAPDNAVGYNGSWAFGTDGHIYFRTGGAWTLII